MGCCTLEDSWVPGVDFGIHAIHLDEVTDLDGDQTIDQIVDAEIDHDVYKETDLNVCKEIDPDVGMETGQDDDLCCHNRAVDCSKRTTVDVGWNVVLVMNVICVRTREVVVDLMPTNRIFPPSVTSLV